MAQLGPILKPFPVELVRRILREMEVEDVWTSDNSRSSRVPRSCEDTGPETWLTLISSSNCLAMRAPCAQKQHYLLQKMARALHGNYGCGE